MKKERVLSFLIAVLLLFAITACTPQDTTTEQTTSSGASGTTTKSTTTTTEATTETTTKDDWITITSLHTENTALVEKPLIIIEARERLQIDWQPTVVGTADYQTKLNSLIASNDYPDIMMFGVPDGKRYVDNGVIIPLNDLLNEYGPDILENKSEYMNSGINSTGDIYGIPQPPGYPMQMIIRVDWLNNLGLDIPGDTESFFEAMEAFTYDDPDQNGENDTLGLTIMMDGYGTFEAIFSAFGFSPYAPVVLDDGTVTTYMKHENFLDSIEYLQKLYDAGVMEPDFISIPQMQAWEKVWNGVTGAHCWSPVGALNNWIPRFTEETYPEMTAIMIKGPDGTGGFYNRFPTGYWGITATCENPDVAMRLGNYFTTHEGDELLYLGIEGVHFEWEDKESGKYKYLEPYASDIALQRADGGFMMWTTFRRINDNTEILTLTEPTREALQLAVDNPMKTGAILETPEIQTELGSTLSDIEKECVASLIVSSGDIESELAEFITRWEDEGGSIWEEQATVIYNAENQ
jgi:putative aldouronate transport system substrate-binding protein